MSSLHAIFACFFTALLTYVWAQPQTVPFAKQKSKVISSRTDAEDHRKSKQNVLMIAIDDMRPEMTPYGHNHMHTPNLQKLADRSMLFSRAYVQVALCMPSRNALLSGRRPDTTMNWDISKTQWPRTCGGSKCRSGECSPECGMKDITFLPGWFYKNGYYTVGMGKIFHAGEGTHLQDYEHSWTPSTTNKRSGIWQAHGGPTPTYKNKTASPSWFAFDVEDEEMGETKLAEHAIEVIRNLSLVPASDNRTAQPFFLAVGFHKPHVPWYAPKKYWDYYPDPDLAPNPWEPIDVPQIAMQAIMRQYATPHVKSDPLSCKYTDLCDQLWDKGSKGITQFYPFDNSTFPAWKARELRRAYWAALSYTDANIGRVLDALDASPFANNTVIALWGDHGYQLGDNDLWFKHTNFEHATRIPFMVHVPGMPSGISDALVEEVDLYPTLVEAATMHYRHGPVVLPHCPAAVNASRDTGLCTEGFSLMPLISGKMQATEWGRAAFSQFSRTSVNPKDDPEGRGEDGYMGYTIRVDKWRFTGWFEFDTSRVAANLSAPVAVELYAHNEPPLPVDWSVEHANLAHSQDPEIQKVVGDLHGMLVKCAARPDLCTSKDFAPYVVPLSTDVEMWV